MRFIFWLTKSYFQYLVLAEVTVLHQTGRELVFLRSLKTKACLLLLTRSFSYSPPLCVCLLLRLCAAAVPRRAPTPSGAVMWQEARKHERKLRGMMVDYRRRGERRREYYEKIVRHFVTLVNVYKSS